MKKLIIANWKMNLTLAESDKFCTKIIEHHYCNNLIISPPIPYLAYLSNKFKTIEFCAQNISQFENNGSYTGEYSSKLVKFCNINYSLIGHSERRNLFSESNELIKQKAENCLKVDITPIICIGESLDVRKKGNYKEFLLNQLVESIPNGKLLDNKNMIIAYEPIWSIGTGVTPSEEELREIFGIINYFIKKSQVANNISLVYGGSINLNNVIKILALQNIDGVLVGKSSLDYQILVQMLNL